MAEDRTKLLQKKKALEEFARRKARLQTLDWDRLMFGPQRAFIEDTARLKVACCSRRAGKSHGIALAMLKAAFKYPGSMPIYLNANRASAKQIIWPALIEIDRELNLGLSFDETTSNIRCPNGSRILVFGVGSRREMEKIRGGKPPIACLDEAQNMGGDMSYLLSQIVLPSLMDYKGQLLVTGTPNASCSGPFHDIVHGGGMSSADRSRWSVHKWTITSNPYIKEIEEEYAIACDAMGWTKSSPGFRREYLGEWVRDTEGLAFALNGSNVVDTFPSQRADDWRYILGVDLGTKDPCAFTTLATSKELQETYALESYEEEHSTISAGDAIQRLRDVYPISGSVVVDSGGQGAAFVKQWKDTHPLLPIQPVKKGYGSVDMGVSIINADLRANKLFLVKEGCDKLISQIQTLVWDDRPTPTGARRIKRGDGYPDHCADSLRYAYTRVRTWGLGANVKGPHLDPNSKAWIDREARRFKSSILQEVDAPKEPFWKRLVARDLKPFR